MPTKKLRTPTPRQIFIGVLILDLITLTALVTVVTLGIVRWSAPTVALCASLVVASLYVTYLLKKGPW